MRVELPLPSFTHFSLSLSFSPVHLRANFYSSLPSLPSLIPGDTRANARESNIFSFRVNCSRPRLLFVLITPERLVPRFHKIVRQAFFRAKRLSLSLSFSLSARLQVREHAYPLENAHRSASPRENICAASALAPLHLSARPTRVPTRSPRCCPVIQTHVGILRAQRQIFFRA